MPRAKTINPKDWYTLTDIVRDGMFPLGRCYSAVRRIVDADRANKNILKAQVVGEGRAKKYHFQGKNIIRFTKLWNEGAGLLHKKTK